MAFDVIGDKNKAVAIIDARSPKEMKLFAKEIMRKHPNVKSVLAKSSARKGKFRKYALKLVTGEKNTEVLHREHGMTFKIDPKLAYFSPREATERQRIAKMVKPHEQVLVMFAGAAPLSITIAKAQPTAIVYSVEMNQKAHDFARENKKLNKVANLVLIKQEIGKKKFDGKFDRVIMPLPESAHEYLPAAKSCAKKNAVIHLYSITDGKFEPTLKIVKANKLKVVEKQIVSNYAPGLFKVRIDLKT